MSALSGSTSAVASGHEGTALENAHPSSKTASLEGDGSSVDLHLVHLNEAVRQQIESLPPEQQQQAHDKIKLMQQAVQNQSVPGQPKLIPVVTGSNDAANLQVSQEEVMAARVLASIRSGNVKDLADSLKATDMDVNHSIRAPSDSEAHPLLHWAALNDQVEVIRYLVSRRANVNLRNPRGEIALHWASLNGHIRCVHQLLESGSELACADSRGYSAMHHAAQHGQVVIMALLHRRGLDVDVRDNNGRTSLHWASYKGFNFAVQWLVEHGADLAAKDFEDCLPIHWTALQGLKSTSRKLLSLGSIPHLACKDRTGGTPLDLAREKQGRYDPSTFEHQQFKSTADLLEKTEKSQGLPRSIDSIMLNHPTWYAWPILAPIGWWQYQTVVFPETAHLTTLTLIFWFFYWAEWVCWIWLQRMDPGSLVFAPDKKKLAGSAKGGKHADTTPENETRLEVGVGHARVVNSKNPVAQEHRDMYDEVLAKGLTVPVCTTCEIVKPLRSKHDRFTDRCISRFDHYCPFMGVAVGEQNYRVFFLSMFNGMISMWSWLILVYYYTKAYDSAQSWWSNYWALFYWELFAFLYLPVAIYSVVMVFQHGYFIKKSMTTNEVMNRARIPYLAHKRNPFDRGFFCNFLEFFRVLDPIHIPTREYYQKEFGGGLQRPLPAVPHGHSHGGRACHGH